MTTVPFTCPKRFCFTDPAVDIKDIKLLKTVVSGRGESWTILTCPKCKETFVADKGSIYDSIAPRTHIASPTIETKP